MAKRKGGKVPLSPWATAIREGEPEDSRYIRVGTSLYTHPAFTNLKPSTRFIYHLMIDKAAGKREFPFPRAYYRERGLSESTVRRAIAELKEAGFIELIFSGKLTRQQNQYRFIWNWKGG